MVAQKTKYVQIKRLIVRVSNVDHKDSSFEYICNLHVLDCLWPTVASLDKILAWFVKIGAPLFTALIVAVMNLSIASSTVPML